MGIDNLIFISSTVATDQVDFTSRQDFPVTFIGGQTEQLVGVSIINDEIYENDEEFRGQLTLSDGSIGVVIGLGTATATIIDDDGNHSNIIRVEPITHRHVTINSYQTIIVTQYL